jgi:ribosomal protein L32
MDGENVNPVIPPLSDANPEYSQCPDCGQEFRPGHLCREGMIEEIARMRAAFQISVTTLSRIRTTLIIWRRGQETEKLYEVSALARNALRDIQELIEKPKVPNEPS